MLNLLDEFSHEWLAIRVARKLKAHKSLQISGLSDGASGQISRVF